MPDRYSRRETTLEATARTIGLSLGPSPRPFLPVGHSDFSWAEEYLQKHHLEKEKFVLIAPFSWPNKVWGKERFSQLIDRFHDELGLRTVVVSYPEIGPFNNPGVVCAFDLSLGQIAGLMQYAGLYVGLDSGPSHMAAFFELPMVVIFVERRTFPFEVRPLTPSGVYVVESFFTTEDFPQVETVFNASRMIFFRNKEEVSVCPVCRNKMQYVLRAENNIVRMMCSCGLSLDQTFPEFTEPYNAKHDSKKDTIIFRENSDLVEDLNLSLKPLKISYLESWRLELAAKMPKEVSIVFSKRQRGLSKDCRLEKGTLQLSLDSLIIWMKKHEYNLKKVDQMNGNVHLYFARIKQSLLEKKEKKLKIPWNNTFLNVTESQYLRWYSYDSWANPDSLVGIVKGMSELASWKREILSCALVAFSAQKTMRSFRWIFKAFLSSKV